MTPDQRAQLEAINLQANNAHAYVATLGPGEPPDNWSSQPIPGWSWECRHYTQMKANMLKQAGWSPPLLAEVLCYTEPVAPPTDPNDPYSGRAYHAVEAVRVEGEVWILDSRFDDIYLWSTPPADYKWKGEQIAGTTDFRDVSAVGLA